MNKATSSSDNPKRNLKVIIPLTIVGLLIVIGLAFILPTFATDGTEKFTGKEAQLAKQAIGDGHYNGPTASPIPNLAIPFKIKATKVYKLEPQKACGPGKSTGVTYIVEISRVTFFGIVEPAYDSWECWFGN